MAEQVISPVRPAFFAVRGAEAILCFLGGLVNLCRRFPVLWRSEE
jgi:hypothetical protein